MLITVGELREFLNKISNPNIPVVVGGYDHSYCTFSGFSVKFAEKDKKNFYESEYQNYTDIPKKEENKIVQVCVLY